MGSIKDKIVQQIDELRLRPSTYMVARRLLDRAHEANGLVVITYEEAAEICQTESQETVRGHLSKLAAADLITYRRNAKVNVFWHGWRDGADQVLQPDANRADTTTNRAEPAHQAAQSNRKGTGQVLQPDANCSQPRAQDSRSPNQVLQPDANRADTTTNRAEPAHSYKDQDQDLLQEGRKDPSYPDLDVEGGSGETPPDASEQISQAEQERSVRLLTDREVGLFPALAATTAAQYTFREIVPQVFRYLHDRDARKARSPGCIPQRLAKSDQFPAEMSAEDTESDLFLRYASEEDLEWAYQERRRKWIPDEYSDIILG